MDYPFARSIFTSTIFVALSMTANGQSAELFEKLTFTGEENTLPYRLLKPIRMTEEKYPLVVFLHGAGERGTDNDSQIRHIAGLFLDPGNRARFPCFVLAPQCPNGEAWAQHNRDGSMKENPTMPAKLTMDLIEKLLTELPIDPDRIYITGVSMGGFGTWDLVARFPGKFAAAVPICGGGDVRTASLILQTPVWAFHGALDKVVSAKASRAMIKALQDLGGSPEYTEYPDVAHNSWVNAYRNPHLLPWLFEHRLHPN